MKYLADTHSVCLAEFKRQQCNDLVDRCLYTTRSATHLDRVRIRTFLSFLSFGVSFALPFFFTFPIAVLEDSGARDSSAVVVLPPRVVAFSGSSGFAPAVLCP